MNAIERPIYLDYNATTPTDPVVLEAMLPFLRHQFGNASSSTHSYGWHANMAVEKARTSAADLLRTQSSSIFFTSGATESINLALLGIFRPYLEKKQLCHLITTQVEHKATLGVARELERLGVEITFLKPNLYGQVTADDVARALKPHTKMVSVIHGNNEIGSLNPILEIGVVCQNGNVLFHVDAAQSLGKVNIEISCIDLLSASAHKVYGPKGAGLLFIAPKLLKSGELMPQAFGGSQEKGLRPGTLNVPSIVGFGVALERARELMPDEVPRLTAMRDEFIANVLMKNPHIKLNGHPTERLYSNISFSFANLSADLFAIGLSGLAVSAGSACAAGEGSHVLTAIGLTDKLAHSTVRIGIGRYTTHDDLVIATNKIAALYHTSQNR